MRAILAVALVLLALAATGSAVRDTAFWVKVLRTVTPRGKAEILQHMAENFNSFTEQFGLTSDLRIAHFLGQCAHESAGYTVTTEFASGAAYNGRRDLGNIQPGDGPRFKGRGLIQLTGRANYRSAGAILHMDLEGNPTSVASFPLALTVSGLYWATRKLNPAADRDDIRQVTRLINGRRMLGLNERLRYTNLAKKALRTIPESRAAPPTVPPTPRPRPAEPVTPSQPAQPAQPPAQPLVPPTQPEQPVVPPTQPEQPVQPPAQPLVPPTQPEQPVVPPTQPEQPVVPPTQPEQPVVPPAEPAAPATGDQPSVAPSVEAAAPRLVIDMSVLSETQFIRPDESNPNIVSDAPPRADRPDSLTTGDSQVPRAPAVPAAAVSAPSRASRGRRRPLSSLPARR